jgi:rRNA maturation protein Nop10
MPYCTHCQREYALNMEHCPECGHLLLPQKPPWRAFSPEEKLVTVRTAQGELVAELLRGQLEQEGIPVRIQRESAGIVYGVTVDGMGAQRLQVPESLAEEAKEVLAAFAVPPPRRRQRFCRFRRGRGLFGPPPLALA